MAGAASSSGWRNGVPPSVTALASLSLGCSEAGLSSVRISKSTSSRFFSTSMPACGMRPTISTFLRFLPVFGAVAIVSPAVFWSDRGDPRAPSHATLGEVAEREPRGGLDLLHGEHRGDVAELDLGDQALVKSVVGVDVGQRQAEIG